MPEECRHLDQLLFLPFRYGNYPGDSRFRRAGPTPGVWYGAEHVETAVVETVFRLFLFYAESPDPLLPKEALDHIAFSASISTPFSVDVSLGELAGGRGDWTNPTDYRACRDFADDVRDVGVEVIRYSPVRDSSERANVAVLNCHAFAEPKPLLFQNWRAQVDRAGVRASCDNPRRKLDFGKNDFASDPGLLEMDWDRPVSGLRLVQGQA